MSETKHTPGPWKYGVRSDKSIWLSIGDPARGPHRQGDLHANEADARLIAAAPDLLTACKEAYDWMNQLPIPTAGCLSKMTDLFAAISKAEGSLT